MPTDICQDGFKLSLLGGGDFRRRFPSEDVFFSLAVCHAVNINDIPYAIAGCWRSVGLWTTKAVSDLRASRVKILDVDGCLDQINQLHVVGSISG